MKTFWDFTMLIRSFKLDLDDAYVLCYIHENGYMPDGYSEEIALLTKNAYITEDGRLLIKALATLEVLYNRDKSKKKGITKSEEFAMKIREIYPRIELHGYSARGSVTDIVNKLATFYRMYKAENFTEEEILEATKNYVEEQEGQGRVRMKLLKYFIMKDNSSMLAEEILKIRGGFERHDDGYVSDKIT
jgi:hypothetical protein